MKSAFSAKGFKSTKDSPSFVVLSPDFDMRSTTGAHCAVTFFMTPQQAVVLAGELMDAAKAAGT